MRIEIKEIVTYTAQGDSDSLNHQLDLHRLFGREDQRAWRIGDGFQRNAEQQRSRWGSSGAR
jgi:hypothetical protein